MDSRPVRSLWGFLFLALSASVLAETAESSIQRMQGLEKNYREVLATANRLPLRERYRMLERAPKYRNEWLKIRNFMDMPDLEPIPPAMETERINVWPTLPAPPAYVAANWRQQPEIIYWLPFGEPLAKERRGIVPHDSGVAPESLTIEKESGLTKREERVQTFKTARLLENEKTRTSENSRIRYTNESYFVLHVPPTFYGKDWKMWVRKSGAESFVESGIEGSGEESFPYYTEATGRIDFAWSPPGFDAPRYLYSMESFVIDRTPPEIKKVRLFFEPERTVVTWGFEDENFEVGPVTLTGYDEEDNRMIFRHSGLSAKGRHLLDARLTGVRILRVVVSATDKAGNTASGWAKTDMNYSDRTPPKPVPQPVHGEKYYR